MAGFGTTKLSPKARKQKKKLQQKYPNADLSKFGQLIPESQGCLAPLSLINDGDPATVFYADFVDGTSLIWITHDDGTNHGNLVSSTWSMLHNRARKKQTVQTLTAVVCYHTTTSIQRLLLAQFLNAPIGEELESEIGEKLFKSGVQCSLLPTSTQQEEELTKIYGTENKIDLNQ